MTNKNPRRVEGTARAVGSIQQTQFTSPPSIFQAPGTVALARQSAESFLAVLDPGAKAFTFQTFRDEHKAKRQIDPLACVLHGSLAEHWNELAKLSNSGAGIFVVINETDLRGRTTEHVVRVRSNFVDFDGANIANLKRLALRPHFVTQTSAGRYHAYWLVDGASLDKFRSTQLRIARLMEGDPSVCDVPRVMRLPGFLHQKDPARPFLVTVVIGEAAEPYGDQKFQAALTRAENDYLKLTRPNVASQLAAPAEANVIENTPGKKPAYLIQAPGRQSLTDRATVSPGSPTPDMNQGFPDGFRTRELTRRVGWCLGPWSMTEEQTIAVCLEWNRNNTPPLTDEKVRSTITSIAKTDARNRSVDIPNQATSHMDENSRDPSQREKIVLIGLDAELWHDKDGNPFATIETLGHQETFSIKSAAFRHWLTHEYGVQNPMTIRNRTCPSAPSTQALTEAVNALAAKAATGPQYQASVRIAEHSGLIYLDLGTADWTAVEISAQGWRIVSLPPVRFIRPAGVRALSVPVHGGSIAELAKFINVKSKEDFIVILSWLIGALNPTGPYVVLIINGEQGSGKTIVCRLLRRLIDANAAELRTDTRDERDLLIAAKNGWIVALDNLSYVRNDLSDAICRIATKGAFATRALYTDGEEFMLEVCRPVLLNGIPPLASRADLADRAVVCMLPTLQDSKRQTERELWLNFEEAAPRILGALLDAVSGALRDKHSIKLTKPCRMMDFATWAEAGCRSLGIAPGEFEAAYAINRSSSNEDAVDADPVAGAVIDLIGKKSEFQGTATELLSALEPFAPAAQRDRKWPKDATRLSSQLRRLPPLLRTRGIELRFGERTSNAARNRLIEIKRVNQF